MAAAFLESADSIAKRPAAILPQISRADGQRDALRVQRLEHAARGGERGHVALSPGAEELETWRCKVAWVARTHGWVEALTL